MKRVPMLSAIALAGAMALPTGQAQAFDRGGAFAAGAIGGLAVGGLIGAAAANSYYGPGYGYGYAPAYGYAYEPAYEPAYVPTRRVVRRVVVDRPVRVVRRAPVVTYDADPYYGYASTYRWGPGPMSIGYGYGPAYW